jgi:hypothetical protein
MQKRMITFFFALFATASALRGELHTSVAGNDYLNYFVFGFEVWRMRRATASVAGLHQISPAVSLFLLAFL